MKKYWQVRWAHQDGLIWIHVNGQKGEAVVTSVPSPNVLYKIFGAAIYAADQKYGINIADSCELVTLDERKAATA